MVEWDEPAHADVKQLVDVLEIEYAIVARALRHYKTENQNQLVEEYFRDPDEFIKKFSSWDESQFSSNREGDATPATHSQAFDIIPGDDTVLNGAHPGRGSTSPPPSRAVSPLAGLTGEATGGVPVIDTRLAHEQEEESYRRNMEQAIRESLSGQIPGVLQLTHPLPPKPQFGPAKEGKHYVGRDWALTMVRGKNHDPDAEPTSRIRSEGLPVFLRCRFTGKSGAPEHKLGGILTILHSIPGMRNTMLRVKAGLEPGEKPGEKPYGYGSDPEWWKGKPILPPEREKQRESKVSQGLDASHIMPPWEDELHRLVAFLDSSERSYGTADILAFCQMPGVKDNGTAEGIFFDNCVLATQNAVYPGSAEDTVEQEPPRASHFRYLHWKIDREELPEMRNIYDVWDHAFFKDSVFREIEDDESGSASMECAPEVLVFWFGDFDGLEEGHEIVIPEIFYLDRYLEVNRDRIVQSLRSNDEITKAFAKLRMSENQLVQWENPKTKKKLDRRVLLEKSIEECRRRIARIKSRAAWMQHSATALRDKPGLPDADDFDDFYRPENYPDAVLEPDELEMIQYYEGKIRQMEKNLADINHIFKTIIQAERESIRILASKNRNRLTVPDPKTGWNPTHRYTLRGVVSKSNTFFLRRREKGGREEQWIKMWSEQDDYTVLHEMVSFESVHEQSRDCSPIFIYATEQAMTEEPEALSPLLKRFVKLDNRSFREELQAFEASKNPRERKRSVDVIEDPTSSESKRHQRSPAPEPDRYPRPASVSSMDSMAPNVDNDSDDGLFCDQGEGQPGDRSDSPAQPEQSASSPEDGDSLMDDLIKQPSAQEAKPPVPQASDDDPKGSNQFTLRGGGLERNKLFGLRSGALRGGSPGIPALQVLRRQLFAPPPSPSESSKSSKSSKSPESLPSADIDWEVSSDASSEVST